MSARPKPIRLSEPDDGVLRVGYFHKKIPRDQYKKRPKDLQELADWFHRMTGRSDEPEELLRYIQNQQKATTRYLKQGREPWPTFDGGHQKAPALSGLLDDEDMLALEESYKIVVLPRGLGTDAAVWDNEVVKVLAAEFTRRTHKIIPGIILLAIAEEKRKRQLWFKVGRGTERHGRGFDDLDALEEASDQ